jgi:hypothetical protein
MVQSFISEDSFFTHRSLDDMTKLFIILTKKEIFVFERKNQKAAQLVPLFGEHSMEWAPDNSDTTFLRLKNEIVDIYNYSDLSNILFDIVYDDVESTSLKVLMDHLTACAGLQIFCFSRILPQLLFNTKKLVNQNDRIHVEFQNEIYTVSVDKKNQVGVKKSYQAPQMRIEISDLPRYLNLLI